MLTILSLAAFSMAALTFGVFFINAMIYRRTRPVAESRREAVSVLIPARNEADKIATAVGAALASEQADVEVIVLDDNSTDETAAIVETIAGRDDRVRLISGQPLPAGWCGKQFACWQLAGEAKHELLLFLDADVTIAPDAIARTTGELGRRELALLSGVPRQIISGRSDGLLIPLIHFVLLGFLPLWMNRKRDKESMAAGCGQFFLTRKDAYLRVGGHEAIRASMHDGLKLPRAYRRVGETTDVLDLTDIVTCRMYEDAWDVWSGLSKNAVEGIAAPTRIVPFSILLFGGHVLPFVLLPTAAMAQSDLSVAFSASAVALSLVVRLYAAGRFRQPLWSALFHPIGVFAFLGIQWWALVRHLTGHRPTWRGRGVASDEPSAPHVEANLLTPGGA